MRLTKTDKILKRIGRELKANPPRILARTKAKKGAAAAKRQRTAILLAKARKVGGNLRLRPQGSGTFTDKEIAAGHRRLGPAK